MTRAPYLELVDLASGNPAAALDMALRLADTSTGHDRAAALLAAGVAHRNLGRPVESVAALERALEDAEGDDDLGQEIVVRLAASLGFVGQFERAAHLLDEVIRVASGPRAGIAEHQRATLHQRAGETRQAIEGYRRAIDLLDGHGEETVEGHIHTNLSILYTYDGRIDEALTELDQAMARYEEAGEPRWTAMTLHNRGWTVSCTGDLPRALELFRVAEVRFAELDIPEGPRLATRAEALFRAGLFERAYAELTRSATEQGRLGLTTDRAETLVMASRAATRSGRADEGRRLADEAADDLARQQRWGWRALAEAARFDTGLVDATAPDILRLARELVEAGHTTSGFQVLTSAAIGAVADAELATAAQLLDALPAIELTPADEVRLALAAAPLAAHIDGADAGLEVCERAFARLDRIMASFGSLDLIGGAAHDLDRLVVLARSLVPREQVDNFLRWGDRRRSIGAWRFPRTLDPAITALVNRYRAMAGQIEENPDDPGLRSEFNRLAEELQERDWTASERRPTSRVDGDRPDTLIDLSVVGERILRTVITPSGISQTEGDLDLSIVSALDRLHQLWMGAGSNQVDHLGRRCHEVAESVATMLFGERGLPDGELTVVTDPELRRVPFPLLPALGNRAFAIAPWTAAGQRRRPTDDDPAPTSAPRRELLIIDPDLVGSDVERPALLGLRDWQVVDDGSGGPDRLMASMERADVVHISAHGGVEPDNPLFSWLELPTGRLFLYDLTRLATAPRVVVVAACLGARDLNRGAIGALSFAEAFLGAGAGWVVAGTSVLPDDHDLVEVITDLHRGLQAGLEPPEALADARRKAADSGRIRAASAFTCYRG